MSEQAIKWLDSIMDVIWSEVESDVTLKSYDYAEQVRNSIIRDAEVYAEYNSLSSEERKKKYPYGFFNTKSGSKSYDAYRLSMNQRSFTIIVEQKRLMFIDNEKRKVNKLVLRLTETLGEVFNVRVGSFTQNLVTVVVDTQNDKNINVVMEVIGAGGYNIQRYHYRWIFHFKMNGQQYKLQS